MSARPGALLRIRPEVAGEDPRIRRIAAIIQRDGHVVAGVHINGDKDDKFGVESRQVVGRSTGLVAVPRLMRNSSESRLSSANRSRNRDSWRI